MSENDENLFPRQRPLRDSDPISQESSTPVGLPAGGKTGKVGRVLFEQIWLEGAGQTGSSFSSQGYQMSLRMVQFNRRQNFLYFHLLGPYGYLASFWSYGEKNEISENESWLLWQRPLKIKKTSFSSFIYSNRGTERWKPCENPFSGRWDNRADRNL